MLTIIVNWIYMLFTTFCMGYAFAWFVEKKFQYHIRHLYNVFMAGIVIATVYAQFFSLFYKVGFLANLVMTIVCAAVIVWLRKEMLSFLQKCRKETSIARKAVMIGLFLVWAYFTSRGVLYYDTDLYHGQSIRWIEEYGVVKGLANLHERFAYNSSLFALSALYSLKFVMGYSMHAVNGLLAFLLSLVTLDVAEAVKRRKLVLSDYARVAAIYYLTLLPKDIASPASDLAVMCVLFFLVVQWLGLMEDVGRKEPEKTAAYSLLCVGGVFALTLKLTAGLILILVIWPAYWLIRGRRWKQVLCFLFMGILVAAPWMWRTVIISGWLFYPLASVDLFSFDWKLPIEVVQADSAQIRSWGKAIYNSDWLDMPLREWFPNWFRTTLSKTEMLLVAADIVSVGMVVLAALWTFLKKKWKNLEILLVLFMLVCSYLFWQLSAPLMRYGYVYVLLLPVLSLGWMLLVFGEGPGRSRKFLRFMRDKLLVVCFVLYGIYKLGVRAVDFYDMLPWDNYIRQVDYGTYDVRTGEIDGLTIYIPIKDDRVGYDPFPAASGEVYIRLRGNDIKDGFRPQ